MIFVTWLTVIRVPARDHHLRICPTRSPIMSRPLLPLKAGAIVFTALWTAWMMWWSGSFGGAGLVILTLCGGLIGYLWYRAMR